MQVTGGFFLTHGLEQRPEFFLEPELHMDGTMVKVIGKSKEMLGDEGRRIWIGNDKALTKG